MVVVIVWCVVQPVVGASTMVLVLVVGFWCQLLVRVCGVQCTVGEELYLRKNIFENLFFKYQKIRTNILTIEKKVS